MANEYILTIDLGTSGPKISVFDFKAKLIKSRFVPTKIIHTPDGGIEQSPDDWIDAINDGYHHIMADRIVTPDRIKAINVTSQWSGTVAVNEQGIPLCNAIIWMDDRGAPYIQKKLSGGINIQGYDLFKLRRWIKLTAGIPSLSGKDCCSHILFIREKMPDIYARTKYFLEPKDYINYVLTDRFCASADGATLHWVTDTRDINNVKYDRGLAETLGIELSKLPDLLPANSIIGKVSRKMVDRWCLNPDTVVISGTPDTHSATIGSGAVNNYEGHIYYGTSTWIMTHLPFKKTDIAHNMATIPSAIPGKYLLTNEQECAGEALNFLRDNLFFSKDELSDFDAPEQFYQRLDALVAGNKPGSHGLFFLPWLNGERAPVDDHKLRGGFYNLSLRHTRADFVRATFEGIAMNSKWLLDAVEVNCKRPFEVIHFIGGGAKSDEWCQILSNAFNRKIAQIEDPVSANSRGAALLALLSLGIIHEADIKDMVSIKKIFSPELAISEVYSQKFEIFKSIYKKNKSLFRRIN